MKKNKVCCALIAIVAAFTVAFAQSGDFTVTGKAVTATGQPVANATVTFTSIGKRLSWDFSDANGNFGKGNTGIAGPASHDAAFSLASAGNVRAEIYRVDGRKIAVVFDGAFDKGTYTFSLPSALAATLARSVYVLKITAAGKVTFQKLLNEGGRNGLAVCIPLSGTPAQAGMAKKMAAVDTIRVGKTGYAPVKISVDSYTATVGNVILTPIDIEGQVNTLFGTLSQAEKVGQLVQVDCPGPSFVTSALLGTIFGGGSDGPGGGAGHASEWASFCTDYQNATQTTGKKIPLLIGFDIVHGFGKCNGATVNPHNIGLGCTFDPAIVQKCYRVAGIEARGGGVNLAFGPCIAVPRNDKWGRVYEGFSESPDLTSAMARAAVLGFQLSDLSNPLVVAACTKHFAGDGGTDGGVDRGNTTGDDAALRAIHLPGYTAAVQAGTASVMASFSSWNGVRMHENRALLTDWLKTGQGFDGFVNGDWDGHITGTTSAANCIIAGLDVPMRGANSGAIGELQTLFNGLYTSGSGGRVDDAVKRLLRVKYKMGLFTAPLATNLSVTATVGSQAHRDIAREAVRKSLVLLKTSAGTLPISKTAKVTLVGPHAQDVGQQCGGWTLGWQGAAGNAMPGTTIRQGFESIGGVGNISYSADGNNITGDVAVVCIGEQPYAEMVGDRTDLSIPEASLVTTAKNSGKKVVCVMITGRPMDISAIADKCDAIVAAWLPGTEGGGIAEVLYGNYEFRGKLSASWPRSTAQEPVNVGDATYDPLYPYDYGLNAAGQELPRGIYQ
jgi:beta-glucosidase